MKRPITESTITLLIELERIKTALTTAINKLERIQEAYTYNPYDKPNDQEIGKTDIDALATSMHLEIRNNIISIREIISELEKENKEICVAEILVKAEQKGINKENTEEIIEKLKRTGDLFSPKPNFISKI